MKLKTGKEEIVCLLQKVIARYEQQTGKPVIRNSNRKNYEEVAKVLSEISNELPTTAETLQHEKYAPDYNPQQAEYPFRKYDITGNQVKDACFNQIVSNPRSFLVDACYIYLYGVGRKGFEKNPIDDDLLETENKLPENLPDTAKEETAAWQQQVEQAKQEVAQAKQEATQAIAIVQKQFQKQKILLQISLAIAVALLLLAGISWFLSRREWQTVKKDMNLLPYQPTQAEIDSLEGMWLCYTGSPQARSSDPYRYHLVVSNVVDVHYKNGYFTFLRYGASFDHTGYMQFEAPGLVSIHSYVKNGDSIESPRHSLLRLNEKGPLLSVISASWNFDAGNRNSIIGIREVYIKQGKGGRLEEVMNTLENAGCHCKILRWHREEGSLQTFNLKNESLDSLPNETLKGLIDEKSILLRLPQENLIVVPNTTGKM